MRKRKDPARKPKVEAQELKRRVAKELGTPPPVFFVRVANTGVRLDVARKSGPSRLRVNRQRT